MKQKKLEKIISIIKNDPEIQNIINNNNIKQAYLYKNFVKSLDKVCFDIAKAVEYPQLLREKGKFVVYPDNTKFFLSKKGYSFLVIEHKPSKRSIIFSDDENENENEDEDDELYHLAFPYIVYILRIVTTKSEKLYCADMYIGYRNKPLEALSDTLYIPNLPNISMDYSVCMPVGKILSTLRDVANDTINSFWNSDFNNDLTECFSKYAIRDTRLSSFRFWEKASKEDSLFPLSVEWFGNDTVENIIERNNDGLNESLMDIINGVVADVINESQSKEDLDLGNFIIELVKKATEKI